MKPIDATPTDEQAERAGTIIEGATQCLSLESRLQAPIYFWLALACALLTSPIKAEREQGKTLVREWKKAGISHAKQMD